VSHIQTPRQTSTPNREALIKAAQQQVQRILLDLEDELPGERIDSVTVDTRNFAALAVEIWTVRGVRH
jgi:DNA-binding LacI/PurR family transcriptional regulator